MTGRLGTIVLTGATSGIGEAFARLIAPVAERLVLLGREAEDEAGRVLTGIRERARGRVDYVGVDYADLEAVAGAAVRVRELAPRVDVLVDNAGMPGLPDRVVTRDGFERTLQVNAIAPALLTRALRPSLAAGSRVVVVASSAHRVDAFDVHDPDTERDYTAVGAYARSKGAVLAWSLAFAREMRPVGVDVVSLCPGLNDTPLSATMMGRIGGSPARGAERIRFAATAPVPSGGYLENDTVVPPSSPASEARESAAVGRLIDGRLAAYVQL